MTTTPHFDELQPIHHDLSRMPHQPGKPMRPDVHAPRMMTGVLLFSESQAYAPSWKQTLDTYLRNFTGQGIPKSPPIHPVDLDVVLSPDQLAGLTHLPIHVPLFHICDRCGGSGHAEFFGCDKCGGAGILKEIKTLDVIIPPTVSEHAIIPLPLRHLGIENLSINLRIVPQA